LSLERTILATITSFALAACGAGASTTPTTGPTPTVLATIATPGSTVSPTSTDAPITLLPSFTARALDATTAAALQQVLDDIVAEGAPDAIASVVTAGGQWSGAAGNDGPGGRAAKSGDEFNIASVGKITLTALMLRLAQVGKLELDAPISDYLGDLPVDANGATVRQALGMRSGIGDTSPSLASDARADCSRVWSRTDVLRSIPPPSGAAGASFQYSNPTYKLLGYAAEHVTGTSLDAALDADVFGPVGEDRILLQGATRSTPKPWALPIAGHEGALELSAYGTGGTLPCVSISTFSFATSAIASDAPSLARWAWDLFSGKLVDQARLGAMMGKDGGYPLSIEALPGFGPYVAYGIHGGQVGYAAFLVIVPGRQAVATLLINDEEAGVEAGARRLIEALGP
jgi:D-alanyl-D-alanine carboxypeptidase